VDYSLFYLRRAREERRRGRTSAEALQIAAATSGRAVLISGITVMLAMTGMFLMGSQVFSSFGIGTVLVVAIALAGSLSVLPAVLSALGDRADAGRVPFVSRLRAEDGDSRLWGAVVGRVVRRPLLWGLTAAGVLIALAIPARTLHTVNSGMQSLPRDLRVMQVYDRVQAEFPGGPQPAVVVVSAPDVTRPRVQAGIAALRRAAIATGEMHAPVTVDVSASRLAARVQIPLAGKGTDAASDHALATLRDRVVPSTIGAVPGVSVAVTGMTANSRDFTDSMKAHAPYVFAFVLGMAFLFLLVMFRSLVIAATAIALNLLSVAAAYGLLVVVFQRGHLEHLLGFRSIGGITSWLPLFLFVILFGLSMDYHVLIVNRIREYHLAGRTTRDAVALGVRSTASVVTAAAFVMVAVFAIFATLGMIEFKMMGVGFAAAVLIDATVVRAVLLPATMTVLGERNWYLPPWLDRLPHLGSSRPERRPAPPVGRDVLHPR
jgi:RND superfamily putative drug exporter